MTQIVLTPATQRITSGTEKGSPSAYGELDSVPRTHEEARELLQHAARALRRNQALAFVSRQLARFLGASSAVWTHERRAELRALLREAGPEGLLASLRAVADHPVAEVMDEATRIVEPFALAQPLAIVSLLDWPPITKPEFQPLASSAAVRVVAARALVGVDEPQIFESLLRALRDPSAEVRDAVVEVLARRGDARAASALRALLATEPDAVVRASIEAALEELGSAR